MSPVVTSRLVPIGSSPVMPSHPGPIGHHALVPSPYTGAPGPFPPSPLTAEPNNTRNPSLMNSSGNPVAIPQFLATQAQSVASMPPLAVAGGPLRASAVLPMAPAAGQMMNLANPSKACADRTPGLPVADTKTGSIQFRPTCGVAASAVNASSNGASAAAAAAAIPPPRSGSCASRHMAAEQRRRARINERLEALREIVPHSARANTAAFLTEVYDYISSLHRQLHQRSENPPLVGDYTIQVQEDPQAGRRSQGKAGTVSSEGGGWQSRSRPASDACAPAGGGVQSGLGRGSSQGAGGCVPGLDLSLGMCGSEALSPKVRSEQPEGSEGDEGKFPDGSGIQGPGRAHGRGAFSAYVACDKRSRSPSSLRMEASAAGEAGTAKAEQVQLGLHKKDSPRNKFVEDLGDGSKADQGSADPGTEADSGGSGDVGGSADGDCALYSREFTSGPTAGGFAPAAAAAAAPSNAGQVASSAAPSFSSKKDVFASAVPESLPPMAFCPAPLMMPEVDKAAKHSPPFGVESSPNAAAAAAAEAAAAATMAAGTAAGSAFIPGASAQHSMTHMPAGSIPPVSPSLSAGVTATHSNNANTVRQALSSSSASRKRKDSGTSLGQEESHTGPPASQGLTSAPGHSSQAAAGSGSMTVMPASMGSGGAPGSYHMMMPMLPPMHPVAMAAAAAAAADAAAAAAVQQWNMAAAVAQAQAQAAVQAHAQAQALVSAVAASSAAAAASAAAGTTPLPSPVSMPLPGGQPGGMRSTSPPVPVRHLGSGLAPPPLPAGMHSHPLAPATCTVAAAAAPKRRRRNAQESKDPHGCSQHQKVVRPIAVRPRP